MVNHNDIIFYNFVDKTIFLSAGVFPTCRFFEWLQFSRDCIKYITGYFCHLLGITLSYVM